MSLPGCGYSDGQLCGSCHLEYKEKLADLRAEYDTASEELGDEYREKE